jgi:aminoglycoside phosphotransferase (APT) family kinase protein
VDAGARDTPDGALAAALAAAATGCEPIAVQRFSTGLQHYVFEARFVGRAPVVVRIATEQGRAAMIGAAKLSGVLRPLGVPLPQIIAEKLALPFPHLVLERLPGADLGNVVTTLPASGLVAIAAAVAHAQRITAGTPSAGRYGYAVAPTDAPYERWSEVLEGNLARSRTRIAAAGFFDQGPVDAVSELVMKARDELDSQPPVPFLHDTTTKNVIVRPEGAFSGIVDVDDLCFGDPRYVLALTLASLAAASCTPDYVDAWMKIASFRDDKVFRLYVALFLVDFMSEHGQAFNRQSRGSSPEARRSLLQDFQENLRRATG